MQKPEAEGAASLLQPRDTLRLFLPTFGLTGRTEADPTTGKNIPEEMRRIRLMLPVEVYSGTAKTWMEAVLEAGKGSSMLVYERNGEPKRRPF